jgi:hypothetical protein
MVPLMKRMVKLNGRLRQCARLYAVYLVFSRRRGCSNSTALLTTAPLSDHILAVPVASNQTKLT